jgi:hypothetical protein
MDNIPAKQIDGKFIVVMKTKSVGGTRLYIVNQIQHFDQLIYGIWTKKLYELYVQ